MFDRQGDRAELSKAEVSRQLRDLGVEEGGVLLVHASFRAVGPIEGGPSGLIEALRDALGPHGTLVMPSWTGADDEPFDPQTTPASPDLGVVADTFWRLPGTLRSQHLFAFAALGPAAARITCDPLPLPPHTPESPVGRVHDLDGLVLLLGVDQDANTAFRIGSRSNAPCFGTAARCGSNTGRTIIAAPASPSRTPGSGCAVSNRKGASAMLMRGLPALERSSRLPLNIWRKTCSFSFIPRAPNVPSAMRRAEASPPDRQGGPRSGLGGRRDLGAGGTWGRVVGAGTEMRRCKRDVAPPLRLRSIPLSRTGALPGQSRPVPFRHPVRRVGCLRFPASHRQGRSA
jgi:hypothetical protein